MGTWVLIFIQLSGVFTPSLAVQPIYFYSKAACDAVALEFNGGPEPLANAKSMRSFAALCRSTGAPER
jgi:hypothetical protein